MDFIERLFGVSPDGGDGSTELMWFIAFVAIALVVTRLWLRRAVTRRAAGSRSSLPPGDDRK
jgi:hypothetical protein